MTSSAKTPEEYLNSLPEDRQIAVSKIRSLMQKNLSPEAKEIMACGMINFVVPHDVYPAGYHCNPKEPLPFVAVASQKDFVAIYHMGMYADAEMYNWFVEQWPLHCKSKLDMGKSCIRLKKVDQIPYDLLAELFRKMSVKQWIEVYEKNLKK